MEQYYIKQGKRYIPVGVMMPEDLRPDGVWFVRCKGKRRTEMVAFAGMPKIDTEKVARQIDFADKLCEAMSNAKETFGFYLENASLYDFAKAIAKEMIK